MSVAACGGTGGMGDDEGDDKKMRGHNVDHFAASSDADDEESDEEDDQITDYKAERRNADLRRLTLNDIHYPPRKRKMSKQYSGIGRSRSSDSLKQTRPAMKKRRISGASSSDFIYKLTRGESDTKLKLIPYRSSSAPPIEVGKKKKNNNNNKKMRVHVDDTDDEESDEEEDDDDTDYMVGQPIAKNKRKMSKHCTGIGRSKSSDCLKQTRPSTKKRRISSDNYIYTIVRGESDTKLKIIRSSSAPPVPAHIPALPPEEAEGTDTDVDIIGLTDDENDKNLPIPQTPIGVVKKKNTKKSMKEKLKITRSSSAPPVPAHIPALPPEEAEGTDTDVDIIGLTDDEIDKNVPIPQTPIGVVKKKKKMKSMKEIMKSINKNKKKKK